MSHSLPPSAPTVSFQDGIAKFTIHKDVAVCSLSPWRGNPSTDEGRLDSLLRADVLRGSIECNVNSLVGGLPFVGTSQVAIRAIGMDELNDRVAAVTHLVTSTLEMCLDRSAFSVLSLDIVLETLGPYIYVSAINAALCAVLASGLCMRLPAIAAPLAAAAAAAGPLPTTCLFNPVDGSLIECFAVSSPCDVDAVVSAAEYAKESWTTVRGAIAAAAAACPPVDGGADATLMDVENDSENSS